MKTQRPRPERPTTGRGAAQDRDAMRQGVTPEGSPPNEERSYEDAQDAAFDPKGDRANDGARGDDQ